MVGLSGFPEAGTRLNMYIYETDLFIGFMGRFSYYGMVACNEGTDC